MRLNPAPLFKKVESLSLRARCMVFLLTIAVLGGGFSCFIYLPKNKEAVRLEQRIGDLERRLFVAKAKARNVEKLKTELAKIETDYEEALELLPDKKEIPSLLRAITRMGKDANLEFLLFKPENDVKNDFYVEIPLSLEVKGKFLDIAAFFDEVGGMERIVNVVNVSMRPEQDFSTMLQTTCTAVTYHLKGEEPTSGNAEGKKGT
jgi:type IV pilus assembly protein PilO